MSEKDLHALTLRGVDHTARPTWRLRETIEFYRDKLGLPLIHVISARGWGPACRPALPHAPARNLTPIVTFAENCDAAPAAARLHLRRCSPILAAWKAFCCKGIDILSMPFSSGFSIRASNGPDPFREHIFY